MPLSDRIKQLSKWYLWPVEKTLLAQNSMKILTNAQKTREYLEGSDQVSPNSSPLQGMKALLLTFGFLRKRYKNEGFQ